MGDGFQLRDTDSGNGTRVNGKPVFATTLRHGDVIEAGGLTCLFLAEADEPRPAAPAPPPETHPIPPPEVRATTKRSWMLAVAGALVLLVAVVFLLSRGSDDEAQALWRDAGTALDAARATPEQAEAKLAEAVPLLERICDEQRGTKLAMVAATRLADAKQALSDLARIAELKGRVREGMRTRRPRRSSSAS